MCSFVISMQFLCAMDTNVLSKLFPSKLTPEMSHITVDHSGQLGNKCFRVATGVSYALDKGYYFMITPTVKNAYPEVFHNFPNISPSCRTKKAIKLKQHFIGHPKIEQSTVIYGYPNSTKYFEGHDDVIRFLFKPTSSMQAKLKAKFQYIFNAQEKYVGLHLRTFVMKGEKHIFSHCKNYFPLWATSPIYYEQAMKHFDEDVTFVVCTDYIPAAKEMLKMYNRKFIYTNNSLEEDFYLISMMNNMIISNSSYAVFAAYLNGSPSQKVVMPKNSLFTEVANEKWIRIDHDDQPNPIGEEYDEWYEICKGFAYEIGIMD